MAVITNLSAFTTDNAVVTFVPLTGSAGDGFPARWDIPAMGVSRMLRPTLEMVTRANANKNARNIQMVYRHPRIVDGKIVDMAVRRIEDVIPDTWTDAQVADYVWIVTSLQGGGDLRPALVSRYAPN